MNGKVTQYKVGDRVRITDGFHTGKQAEIIKIFTSGHIRVRYDGEMFMAGLYKADQIALIPPQQPEAQTLAAPEVVEVTSVHITVEQMYTELETLRAELDAARADVVRLTAENRRLTLALNRALDGLLTLSRGSIGDYSSEFVAGMERDAVQRIMNSEVNS